MGRIIVIGAGLGGTAAALGLTRQGFKVRLFEQAPRFERVGAGLTVAPSVVKALDYLGVGAAFNAALDTPQPLRFLDYRTGMPIFAEPDRGPLGQDHLSAVRRIHRADLHEILTNALLDRDPGAITFGAEFDRVEHDKAGVTAHFTDGSSAKADLLIGADGIRSATRRKLTGADAAEFTGYVAWRLQIPIARVERFLNGRFADITIGPGANFTTYRVSRGSVLNVIALARTETWQQEGWRIPATMPELQAHFRDWNGMVQGIIAAAAPDNMVKWGLFDRAPLASWAWNRVALLGDAAHPVTPFLGMGAGLAIEDAVVLARCLAESAEPASLLRYQNARITRAAQIYEASHQQGATFDQIPSAASMRQSSMLRPELFTYDPVEAMI